MRALILIVLVALFTCAVVSAVAFNACARVIIAAPSVPQADAHTATGALDLLAGLGLVAAVLLCGFAWLRRGW